MHEQVRPLLKRYCLDCHGKKAQGGFDLTDLESWPQLEGQPQLLEKMLEVLRKGEMPPEDQEQPTAAQRQFLLAEFGKSFRAVAGKTSSPFRLRRMNRFEYGNAVRDLFELESWVYSVNDRIIRDHNDYFRPESGKMPKKVVVGNRIMGLQQMLENRLLGVMAFPKDAPAENGFNNRGDHLSLSPVLMRSFLELSRSVVNAENFDQNCGVWNELFADPSTGPHKGRPRWRPDSSNASSPRPSPRLLAIKDPARLTKGTGVTISAWIRPNRATDGWQTIVRREDSWRRQLLAIGKTGSIWGLWMGAGIGGRYVEFGATVDRGLLTDGEWHHVVGAFDGKEISLYVDGRQIGSKESMGKLHTGSTGPMQIGDYGNGKEPFHGELNDIRLYRSGLTSAQIKDLAAGEQQVAKEELVAKWRKEAPQNPKLNQPIKSIAHQRIKKFLLKAFRAPADVKTSELYTSYFDTQYHASGDFTQSMKDVVSAALASPRFILVHNGTNQELPGRASFNLATRLSFFLWCSIPDDELLTLARAGKLQGAAVLSRQVDRMLNDHRVKNFCDSFAPQWLRINNLVSASPDFEKHREYYFGGDDKISYKRGMHMMLEPLLNFETVFVENRPLMELIDADFTYRSHLLSEWYEGRAATYPINVNLRHIEFTRIPLNDKRYGGVLTTSAVMVMTSNPLRSQPITRGAWVSSVIFNDPPEPPPEDVPAVRADDKTLMEEGVTIRQKLRQHSNDDRCAVCHDRIDPLGFALENYDLLGRWRDKYRTGIRVDASGKLFGKHEFADVIGFKDAIRAEKELFVTAFVKHLLSFGLGRELTSADQMAAAEIARASEKDDYRMRDVIRNIVVHPIFTQKGRE